ncbi:Hypothetical_protein [Hexamita inflata]|uniref:Hypothetical_protein n=1 Tax=Hexamita inflata TaxID=28002 RepID=A0AA86TLY0_9EUKA|nr:Hypothetical protein HINF_LOCUS8971 [Hexamita inflata]
MYVRRTSAAKATNDSGTSIYGRNAAALCKPIYTGIHMGRTICASKEAMEIRLPLSNPEGSLMACPQPYRSLTAAQHFEPGDFTFSSRFGRAASQEEGCGEEREARSNEPIIDHTKQSWYFSNASSALTSDAEPNRSYKKTFVNANKMYEFVFKAELELMLEPQFKRTISAFRVLSETVQNKIQETNNAVSGLVEIQNQMVQTYNFMCEEIELNNQ